MRVVETLYKEIDAILHYREAWIDGDVLIEHWGIVGDKGELRESQVPSGKPNEHIVCAALHDAVQSGFRSIDDDEYAVLVIEYAVQGFGKDEDLRKRYALQEFMDEFLGWTALGYCDGGSIGSGTMEVTCYVVDFEIAKEAATDILRESQYADYARIFEE